MFNIDEQDIAEYAQQIKEDIENSVDDEWNSYGQTATERARTQEFYPGLRSCFDTVGPDIVQGTLVISFNLWSSLVSNKYEIEVINDINDTARFISLSDSPYHLPWSIKWGGITFETFNIELAKVLMSMFLNHGEPIHTEATENPRLLRLVADYLYIEYKTVHKEEVFDREKE